MCLYVFMHKRMGDGSYDGFHNTKDLVVNTDTMKFV